MDLAPGTHVERIIPSTTGRDIQPGDIGVVDAWNGPGYYFPVQWLRTGLWSMMDPADIDIRYKEIQ